MQLSLDLRLKLISSRVTLRIDCWWWCGFSLAAQDLPNFFPGAADHALRLGPYKDRRPTEKTGDIDVFVCLAGVHLDPTAGNSSLSLSTSHTLAQKRSRPSPGKACKHYETPWFHNFQPNQNSTRTRNDSDDTQTSRPDLRFASRRNSKGNKERADQKRPHQNHRICLRRSR